MKTIAKILFISFVSINVSSQTIPWPYTENTDFDTDTFLFSTIYNDTISNQNNIWQIGVPNKIIFNSAYSGNRAILTDTLNPYPINDTSSFIILYPIPLSIQAVISHSLRFLYKIDSDTLSDFGKVEMSMDKGISWIDLSDSVFWNGSSSPILTGNSGSWKNYSLYFDYNFSQNINSSTDTLLYKFTFISDSIQTNKDGWMIDDIWIADAYENVDKLSKLNKVNIYPNPVNDVINVSVNKSNYTVNIYGLDGKLIYTDANTKQIDMSAFANGIYQVVIITDNQILETIKVVKQ